MTRVLITGANGFIGSHLARALVARGDEVTCLVRKTSQVHRLHPLKVRLAYGDVTERESLGGPLADQAVVYHLAGCLRALRVRQFYRVNGAGVYNVAQTCAEQASPPVLVVVSSLAAAGPARDGQPLTESHPPAPVSHYGRSKRAGELAARQWADLVPITIVRPAGVFGEADRGCLEMFKPLDRFGIHLAPVWPTLGLSVIHAADLVNLLILAAERGRRIAPAGKEDSQAGQGVYFAACDEHRTYAELGRMIAEALGRRRVLVLPTPAPVVWTAAAATEIVSQIIRRPAVFNLDKAREATAGFWFCSSQAAANELGFSVGAPLGDRLRQTAQWYRENGWL